MKILYLYSDKISISDIPWGLLELGEDVENYDKYITLQSYIEEEKEELAAYLQRTEFDCAITHNFSPTISDACQICGVKYISWVFDSPQIDLYTPCFYNTCNYIFVFDKMQYKRLLERSPKHLYYMPLATNVMKYSGIQIDEEDVQKYSNQIAFVGSLYEENVWNQHADKIVSRVRRKMEEWMEQKALRWEKGETIFGCLDETDIQELKNFYIGDWIDISPAYFYENQFLARKLGEIERSCILNILAKKYSVTLYTGSDTSMLKGVQCHPPIDITEVTPKVYHLSKINLNITLRSIETGVPQRVFDIMCMGGFVLSNYQEELEELFVPDKEIVLFHNTEELLEKVAYYLSHERERVQIAMNGYKKVQEMYAYPIVLKKILDMVRE